MASVSLDIGLPPSDRFRAVAVQRALAWSYVGSQIRPMQLPAKAATGKGQGLLRFGQGWEIVYMNAAGGGGVEIDRAGGVLGSKLTGLGGPGIEIDRTQEVLGSKITEQGESLDQN